MTTLAHLVSYLGILLGFHGLHLITQATWDALRDGALRVAAWRKKQ